MTRSVSDPSRLEDNQDLDPRVRDAVNHQEAEVYRRIAGISYQVRDAMNTRLDSKTRKYVEYAPTSDERIRRQAKMQRKQVRGSVGSAEFERVRDVLAQRVPAMYTDGTDTVATEIFVNFAHPYWNSLPRDQATIARELSGVRGAVLFDRGVSFTRPHAGFPATGFSPAQAEEIARLLVSYDTLRASLQDGGTSSPNAALAMQIARDLPAADLTRLMGGGAVEADPNVVTARTRATVARQLERIGRVAAQPYDRAAINGQITAVNQDMALQMLPTDTIRSEKMAADLGVPVGANYPLVDAATRTGWKSTLRGEQGRLEASRAAYADIVQAGLNIVAAYTVGGTTTLPPEVTQDAAGNTVLTTTGFDPVYLTRAFNPESFVNTVRTRMGLPATAAEADTQLATARTNAATNATPRTGRELILSLYAEQFRRAPHNMDATQARLAAEEMYLNNLFSREQQEQRKENIATPEVLGTEPVVGTDHLWEMGTEMLTGREEAFVCNLATKINRNMVSGLTRIPTGFRRPKAQPNWGRGTFSDMWTALYALRDAARNKDVRNTSYVRSQINQITAILEERFSREVLEEFESRNPTPAQREQMRRIPEDERTRRMVNSMLVQTAPEKYSGRVADALDYSRRWTGRARKAVGEWSKRRYRNVRHGEGSIINPLTYPARVVKGVGATGRAIKRGIGGLFSGFIAAARKKKSLF